MSKMARTFIAAALVLVLTACGFFLGNLIKVDVKLADPIVINEITLKIDGADANSVIKTINSDEVANRLVENLMLQCTAGDLQASLTVEAGQDADTVVVSMPMDQDGQMVYFAEELVYVVQEKLGENAEDVRISLTSEKQITQDTEKKSSMAIAVSGAVVGLLVGCAAAVAVLRDSKENGKYAKK